MARGKSRSGRDISNPSLTTRLPGFVSPSYLLATSPLYELQDFRTYHPEALERAPLAFPQDAARVIVTDRKPSARQVRRGFRVRSQTKAIQAFADPSRVVVCVRRHQRKEVLHALRRTGKGARARRRHFKRSSRIKC